MPSVALICTANRCRSVIAHAIFISEIEKRGLAVEVYSGGVVDFRGAPAIDDTTRTCAQHDTPAPSEVATWVRDLPLNSITRFFVMEQYHAEELITTFGVAAERVSLLGEFDPQRREVEIADPYSLGIVVYDECYRQIRVCILNYLDQASELTPNKNVHKH